jgi:ATP-dependent DNA helicase RecG
MNLMVDGKLTNAGYYLFGNNHPLVYKAVEYPTNERLDPIDLKRFEGNIFNLIDEIINYAMRKIDWRSEIIATKRKDIPEIPVVALREIIINSLVHCDYISDTEHQITIDPTKMEIYNPGVFGEYTPRDYVKQCLPSKTKHKVIQGVIYKAFDIEPLGRGLKRMDKYCQEANVKWDYIKYPFGFSFIFLRKKYQDSFNLSNDANKLLDYMKNNNGILENKAKACVLIDKKERTISTLINELIKNQKIIRIGSNKTGYWKINI